MATAPTYEDLFETGVRQILIKPTRYNPAVARDDGSDVNVAIAWTAAMGEDLARYAQRAFAERSLATAAAIGGEALDRYAYDYYRMVRIAATSSVVTIRLNRQNTSTGTTVEAGSQFGTEGGIVFNTISDVAFPLGSAGPFYVQATCQQTGRSGNVEIGSISEVISQLEDTTVTVTNEEAAAGGGDEEGDTQFEQRIRDAFTTAPKGTEAAVLTGARNTPGVGQATAIEQLDPNGDPAFRAQLIVADLEGRGNSALGQRVRLNLAEWRAMGMPVSVMAGSRLYVDIVIEGLTFEAGANTTTLIQSARNAVVAAVNSLAPGKRLDRSLVIAAIKSIEGIIVPEGAVTEPAGDLIPESNRTIRTTKDRVQINP